MNLPLFRRAVAGVVCAFALSAPLAAQEPIPVEGTPLYGGTLVAGMAGEPSNLNPDLSTNLQDLMASSPIFSKLVELGQDEEIYPDLAESWEVSEDGLTYTFNLRQGVLWHDGTPFTSADVKFTFDEVLEPLHGQGGIVLGKVDAVETPDDHTVVLKLPAPYDPLLVFLGRSGRILPAHIYAGTDIRENPANAAPVGTGPFKFETWERGNYVSVVRNEDYFIEGQPFLDRMIFRFIPDASGRSIALETGEVDYVAGNDLPTTAIPQLQANPELTVTNRGLESGAGILQIMFNHERAPFDNAQVRKALSYAVDREFLIERAGLGMYEPAKGPISSQTAWAYDAGLPTYDADPARAEELLDAAGFPRQDNGVRFATTLLVERGNDNFFKAAEVVSQQFRAIGVDLKLVIADKPSILESVYINRDFDSWINGMSTGPTPSLGIARQYVSTNIRPVTFTNTSAYSSPQIDELFQQAEQSTDRAVTTDLFRQIQALLVEDAAELWLYETATQTAYRSIYKNLHTWSPDSPYALAWAYSSEGSATR